METCGIEVNLDEMKETLKESISALELDMRETSSIVASNVQYALDELQKPFNALEHYSAIVKLRNQLNDAEHDMCKMHCRWQVFGDTLAVLEKITENDK